MGAYLIVLSGALILVGITAFTLGLMFGATFAALQRAGLRAQVKELRRENAENAVADVLRGEREITPTIRREWA